MKILNFEASDMVSVNGTSLQGHLTTTYDRLVEIFGPPQFTDANPYEKISCEWTVEAEVQDEIDSDSTYYKNFTVYCWKYGRIPTEECEWYVGGKDFESWSVADDIINGKV